jgi:hypothetical protein
VDPDLAFFSIRIRIQGAKPMRIRILVRLKSQKFLLKIHLKLYEVKKYSHEGRYKIPFETQKTNSIVNFGQIPCSWIRICIPNTDPDPEDSQMDANPDPLHGFMAKKLNPDQENVLDPDTTCLNSSGTTSPTKA